MVQQKSGGLFAGAGFFGVSTVILLYQATHGPAHTRSFLLVMAILSSGFVGAALTAIARRTARELVINEKAIILANRAIRFDEVLVVEEHRTYGQVLLMVRSANQNLAVMKSHLPDGAYAEVVELVKKRSARA